MSHLIFHKSNKKSKHRKKLQGDEQGPRFQKQ